MRQDAAMKSDEKAQNSKDTKDDEEAASSRSLWWACSVNGCDIVDSKVYIDDRDKRLRKIGHMAMHSEQKKSPNPKRPKGTTPLVSGTAATPSKDDKMKLEVAAATKVSDPPVAEAEDENAFTEDHNVVGAAPRGGGAAEDVSEPGTLSRDTDGGRPS